MLVQDDLLELLLGPFNEASQDGATILAYSDVMSIVDVREEVLLYLYQSSLASFRREGFSFPRFSRWPCWHTEGCCGS